MNQTIEELRKLPLSGLISVAVEDIIAAKEKGYRTIMSTWGHRNGTCSACFAGHCLFAHINDPAVKHLADFINDNEIAGDIAYTLDAVRSGDVKYAVRRWKEKDYLLISDSKIDTNLTNWLDRDVDEDFEGFVEEMKMISSRLKSHNL